MNRYPLWKNLLVLAALVLGFVYTLPNFYGEAPAVQVLPLRSNLKADAALLARVEDVLKAAQLNPDAMSLDATSVKARFKDTDTQLKAKDVLHAQLGDDYVVALNLLARSPQWLTSMNALPMYLGLDLARRCAFSVADRYERRAGQGSGVGFQRYSQHLARGEYSLFRREP